MTEEQMIQVVDAVKSAAVSRPRDRRPVSGGSDVVMKMLLVGLVTTLLTGAVTLLVGFVGAVAFQRWDRGDEDSRQSVAQAQKIESISDDVAGIKIKLEGQEESRRQLAVVVSTIETMSSQMTAMDTKVDGFQASLQERTRDRVYRDEYDEERRRTRADLSEIESAILVLDRRIERIEQGE